MRNFKHFITPDEAVKIHNKYNPRDLKTAKYYEQLAKDYSLCEVCKEEIVWRFADCGMCFSCTTGEADASDDYELKEK